MLAQVTPPRSLHYLSTLSVLSSCSQCCVGTELVDWLIQQSSCVHSRGQAVGMWQVLVEEEVLNHGEAATVHMYNSVIKGRIKKHAVLFGCMLVKQWIRSRVSRTNTSSTASWKTNRTTPFCPVRRRGRRARRSCRTLCSSCHRLDLMLTWGWFWGNSRTFAAMFDKFHQQGVMFYIFTYMLFYFPARLKEQQMI